MVEDRIGLRYASAIFELAEERQILTPVFEDMSLVQSVIEENLGLRQLLASPLINAAKKQVVLEQIFAGKTKSDLVPMLLRLLLQKGRERFLPQVATAFLQCYDEAQGIVRGVLTAASALDTATLEDIRTSMEQKLGKRLVLDTQVDATLIGGFVLRIGDQLFDGSVLASLRRIRHRFAQPHG
ncbi:MAG: ATP synthase F1 subunit delta [Bacteroidia bacterium]